MTSGEGLIGYSRDLPVRTREDTQGRSCSRPLCRTKCIERLKAYRALYKAFKAQFQLAFAVLREGIYMGVTQLSIEFPSGGVPLFGGYVAPC